MNIDLITQKKFMLPHETYPNITSIKEFIQISVDQSSESLYPVRNNEGKKLDASELFSHFTANIIKEDIRYIR